MEDYLRRVIREGRFFDKVLFEFRFDLLRELVVWRFRNNILGKMYSKFKRIEVVNKDIDVFEELENNYVCCIIR